jgi:hypothetical protein
VRAVLLFAACAGLAALAARAEEGAPCAPREAERGGARFVSLCGAGVWISATPLACPPEEAAPSACDPVTALEASSLPGPGRNRHVDVLVTDAASAQQLCKARFGGRLPTSRERDEARRTLGLVSLQVREEPGEFARLRLDELPEWVAEGGRARRSPEPARPRTAGEVLLGCIAEPALPRARAVEIGEVCNERPAEADVRSPDCAVAAPTGARFELGCDPEHPVASRSRPEDAALRCVLPAGALPAGGD